MKKKRGTKEYKLKKFRYRRFRREIPFWDFVIPDDKNFLVIGSDKVKICKAEERGRLSADRRMAREMKRGKMMLRKDKEISGAEVSGAEASDGVGLV